MRSASEEVRDVELEYLESPPEIDLLAIAETEEKSPSSPRRVLFVDDDERQPTIQLSSDIDVGDGESVPSSPAKSSPDVHFENCSSFSSLTTGRTSYATKLLRTVLNDSFDIARWRSRRRRPPSNSPQLPQKQRRKKPQVSPLTQSAAELRRHATPPSYPVEADDDASSVCSSLWRRAMLRSPRRKKKSPFESEEEGLPTTKKRVRDGYHHDDDDLWLRSPRRKRRRRRGGTSQVSENYGTVHKPPCLARCCIFVGAVLVVLVISALFYNPARRRIPSSNDDDDDGARLVSNTDDLVFDVTEPPTLRSTPPLPTTTTRRATVVEEYGNLVVNRTRLYSSNTGAAVQLRGVSLSDDEDGSFYTRGVVEVLAKRWNCSVVRAVVRVQGEAGYLEQPEVQRQRVSRVVDAALEFGIYVVVDWHTSHAEDYVTEAVFFFADIVSRYGSTPNVLFEIYGRPVASDWAADIKPYAETIANVIRRTGCPNLLIVGTSTWNQDVDQAALDPIDDVENLAYALHFSARTHQGWLRDKASAALDAGAALFVSQWSATYATGDGDPDLEASGDWIDFLDASKISHINWRVDGGDDDTAALLPGTDASNPAGWTLENFSPSGVLVLRLLSSSFYSNS